MIRKNVLWALLIVNNKLDCFWPFVSGQVFMWQPLHTAADWTCNEKKCLGCACLCAYVWERENYWPYWAESYHFLTCFKSGWWDLILSSVFHWHRQQDPALISVRRDCCRWHGSEKRSSDPPAAFSFSHVHLSPFSAEWWHHWSPIYAYQGFTKVLRPKLCNEMHCTQVGLLYIF